MNLPVYFIVSWSQPLHLKKLYDSKVNGAFEGIIISFTLHSDSGFNTERWSTERHNVPYFRATEQLVQLTERESERVCVVRYRGLKEGGNRKVGGCGQKVGIKCACTCCPKNNRKDFALNDSEQSWNIYWGERFMSDTYMNSLLWPHYIMIQYLVFNVKKCERFFLYKYFKSQILWTSTPNGLHYVWAVAGFDLLLYKCHIFLFELQVLFK